MTQMGRWNMDRSQDLSGHLSQLAMLWSLTEESLSFPSCEKVLVLHWKIKECLQQCDVSYSSQSREHCGCNCRCRDWSKTTADWKIVLSNWIKFETIGKLQFEALLKVGGDRHLKKEKSLLIGQLSQNLSVTVFFLLLFFKKHTVNHFLRLFLALELATAILY